MSTISPRINITTPEEVRNSLIKLANRDKVTLSTKAAELLMLGLSIEEDLILTEVAKERMHLPLNKYIKHEDVWK